jgi:ubiquitin carboxyl-terminal hydrolase 9/24
MGLDFLWELCLNTPDETIADSAIQLLLNMSYTNLASRMKKVTLLSVTKLQKNKHLSL